MSAGNANIPPELLNAAAQARGQIVLVVGAGCSCMAPTNVPMAKKCAETRIECSSRMAFVHDGECLNPMNLSELADVVFASQRQRQTELIKRLPLDKFKRARANKGHMIAAALLREGVISSILCLNFDLAFEDALTALSAIDVRSIGGPEDVSNLAAHNVVYIHRNVNEADFLTLDCPCHSSCSGMAWPLGSSNCSGHHDEAIYRLRGTR